MKINEVILQTVTKVVVYVIFALGLYLFFSGHHAPGGGFVGGLVLASSIVLLLLAFDIETMRHGLPLNFKLVAAVGSFLVVATGLGAAIFGEPFLKQAVFTFSLPIYGEMSLSTVTIFEAGVALTVVGVVITIILSIAEDG